ncbi:DNA-binding transcriptional regulator, LysR family [Halopseudomonas litoralis]|uniref:DNA-binding transcriptional regulator, LysR family n=1 Tax=Halopseudomonas litoralis TaxID=797277 RepID=A0A1H1QJR7_9GAMM|nr:LysR family transcriptional regulator [Halopseudomonas litoralis]SDS23664.1 DNA-binding transcriptional regulator, LysR family [Halopseudomonas litoralis]
MLNLVWIKTLVALLQHRSFQVTADRLGIAQPTVTQHIQKLEEQLQVGLVVRGRTGCQPTPEALLLLPYAESMLKLNERAMAAISGRDLRVGASSNIGIYILQPYVRSFVTAEHSPDLELAIGSNPIIAQKLQNAEVDVAVMEWWQPQTGFQARSWRKEPLVLIVPPTHPYAALSQVGPEHLAGMELIGGESGTGTGRLLDRYFAHGSAIPGVSMQLGSTEAVKQAVKAGLGISLVLASTVTEEVQTGSLCAVPFSGAGLDKELMVVWRENPAKSDQLPDFVSHLLNGGGGSLLSTGHI